MKNYMLIGLILGTMATGIGCSTQPPAQKTPPQNAQVQSSSQTNSGTPSTSTTQPSPTAPASTAADGKSVYDKNCAGCHGAGGSGGSAQALNSETRPINEVADVVKNGKGSMPGFSGTLNSAEIQAVSQYVAGLKK
jgi:mono/diheme cytochrome c family protein